MARPRKGEGLLNERVVFRLRPEEGAGLKWAADQAGMHPADLTRALLRAALAAGPAYFDDDIEQMQALIRRGGASTPRRSSIRRSRLSGKPKSPILSWSGPSRPGPGALLFVTPYTISDKAHAHPDHGPLWAPAQDLGVPIGIHPVAEPPKRRVYQRFLSRAGQAGHGRDRT